MQQWYTNKDIDSNIVSILNDEFSEKRVAIFIGSHRPFSSELTSLISSFAAKYDAPVFCDHTSCYNGRNKILSAVAGEIAKIEQKPEIVIDMGGVTGAYSARDIIYDADKFFRISENGGFHCRYGKTCVSHFEMDEHDFFSYFGDVEKTTPRPYYSDIKQEISKYTISDVSNMPFSNVFVSFHISKLLPNKSFLSLGIMNSLRSMNFFELDESVKVSANVGGFGIDGGVSSLIGNSMNDRKKLYFLVTGDLAFFYDMNALGIKHIEKNVRILVVNNNCGVEMMLNKTMTKQIGDVAKDVATAKGHYKTVKPWAESMGFKYIEASLKKDFLDSIDDFCSANLDFYEKPVIYEVFTNAEDDAEAVSIMRSKFKYYDKKG